MAEMGPYGFSKDRILVLQEYYPNASEETYKGVSAYVYSVDDTAEVTASSTILLRLPRIIL